MELEVYSMGSIVAGFFYLAQCPVGHYPFCDSRQHVNTLSLYGRVIFSHVGKPCLSTDGVVT